MAKACPVCSASFSKKPKATYAQWERQKFCSSQCGSSSIRLGTPAERLDEWSIPEPNSGCWLWLGNLDKAGYGVIVIDGKRFHAHRLSFSIHNGPIPEDAGVLHHCDLPPCINPDHLYAGSPADNARDRVVRNRTCFGSKNPMAKLNEEMVSEIRAGAKSVDDLALEFGVSAWTIQRARLGRTWRRAP